MLGDEPVVFDLVITRPIADKLPPTALTALLAGAAADSRLIFSLLLASQWLQIIEAVNIAVCRSA